MTKEELEKLTKEAVMSELSQNFLDGREILDFDEVLNVVQAVVKNCSIPAVVGQSEQCKHQKKDLVRNNSAGFKCICGKEVTYF